ncbi:hypothetical protein CPB83DRAFT_850041 [Crepidotus variabilis]|uniref:pyranose dehydrogenase (acceptor) n=1 Tax=Crepidotus variabilis TaxID=179855 RepID=A0A9P6EL17_9AGAR|nr:hypothetical protein CPB83DRAFT_850041 [Crepidotus variabilis]
MRLLDYSLGIVCFVWTANAAVYTKFEDLPSVSFDYVIVGAGTAGNVLAYRLTEDASASVLVIEAGPSDENVLPAIAPFLAPGLTPNTPYDWNYTTVPRESIDNRSIPYNRGHILGGSSSANYHVHQYGPPDDYDKLAAITGDNGWSWDKIKKYVYKHEKFRKPVQDAGEEKRYIQEDHGTQGIVPVSLPGHHQAVDDLVIAATRELPHDFPYSPDTSGILGLGWAQSTIDNGTRQSSSTTYLRSANSRPNLSVLIETQVLKLLPTSRNGGKPAFRGVLLSNGESTPNYVFAKNEVILSAGSIGTPQLLLLSGIGPKEDLESHGIHTLVDNPSVGHNFSDHIYVPYHFAVRGADTLDDLLRNPALMQAAIGEWMVTQKGPISNGVLNQFGFFRFPSNTSIFDSTPDPATGPNAPHWEMMICNFWLSRVLSIPPTGNFLSLLTVLGAPISRGFVKLSSADPLHKPIIDPQYLTKDYDTAALREAARAMKKFASAKAFSDFIIEPVESSAFDSDETLDDHIRKTVDIVFHAVGTGSMSKDSANWGVVNSKLKVKGTDGLRVVDASVWPFVPSVHTQGPTYLVAERAADIILDEYKSGAWDGLLHLAQNVWSSPDSSPSGSVTLSQLGDL